MAHIVIHFLRTLPASNPNRGKDGFPKYVDLGGTARARMSSQSIKRAARTFYQKTAPDIKNDAFRSRCWPEILAKKLKIGNNDEERLLMAGIIIALFAFSADKVLGAAIPGENKNLLFLGEHELDAIAWEMADHEELLTDLAGRVVEYQETLVHDGTKKAPSYQKHPTKKELAPLNKAIMTALGETVPGDVALFGRMMSNLTNASIDGSIQVADAFSINSIPLNKVEGRTGAAWAHGQVDWWTAMDDKQSQDDPTGAANCGEKVFNSATYYQYCTIDPESVIQKIGDRDVAMLCIKRFINAFLFSCPDGMQSTYGHGSLPDFVYMGVVDFPFSLSGAFSLPIDEPNEFSIPTQGAMQLKQWLEETKAMYSIAPRIEVMSAMPSVLPGAEASISQAIDVVISGL